MVDRVSLTTGRLQLRPWRPGDVADVCEYANDEEFSRFLPAVPYPYSIEDAEQFVASCVSAPWETDARFAVIIEGRVAGGVDIRTDTRHAIAELGYALARRYWGQGYMTEAVATVIAWCFQSRRLEKVWAMAAAENEASLRVMEKVGMVREGVLRSHRVARDGRTRVDIVTCGLLRAEWRPGGGPEAP